MLTINLEKSLLRENKQLVLPEELLYVREYEKLGQLTGNETLSRVGLNRNIAIGERVQKRIDSKKEETKGYNQERVFHISQIKSMCLKYRLRFLLSAYYKGTIDEHLSNRIETFEVAYGKRCNAWNTFIMAPAHSFQLEKRPKDPLFLYGINDEYYYLVHKWGNDLSIFRRLLSLLEKWWFCWGSIFLLFCSLFLVNSKFAGICSGGVLMIMATYLVCNPYGGFLTPGKYCWNSSLE